MHKIVLLDKPRENPGELDWSPLQALGETVFYAHTEPEEAAARIGDAEIVLLNKTVLTAETLRQCKNLKLISVIATGYNTVDVDCCRELGITVCNVPSYGSEAISQNAIALLLELTNRVAHHDAEVRKGRSGGHHGDHTERRCGSPVAFHDGLCRHLRLLRRGAVQGPHFLLGRQGADAVRQAQKGRRPVKARDAARRRLRRVARTDGRGVNSARIRMQLLTRL